MIVLDATAAAASGSVQRLVHNSSTRGGVPNFVQLCLNHKETDNAQTANRQNNRNRRDVIARLRGSVLQFHQQLRIPVSQIDDIEAAGKDAQDDIERRVDVLAPAERVLDFQTRLIDPEVHIDAAGQDAEHDDHDGIAFLSDGRKAATAARSLLHRRAVAGRTPGSLLLLLLLRSGGAVKGVDEPCPVNALPQLKQVRASSAFCWPQLVQ